MFCRLKLMIQIVFTKYLAKYATNKLRALSGI